jgi:hypothetical protein
MCEGAPGTFRRRGQAIGVYWLAIAAAMTLAMAVWRNGAMQRRFVAKDIIVVFYNEAFSHRRTEVGAVRPAPAKVKKLMLDAVIDDA